MTVDLSRPEASVTSSDEDKIDTGTSGQAHQVAASSSSRTGSPTPSSGQQSIGDQNSQQSQHRRVRLTPIVWDQPSSSSSSSVPPATRPVSRGRGSLLGRPMMTTHQLPPDPNVIQPIRGAFRQLRGTPSARRSRPHARGTRGSPFSKGPY